MTTASLDTPTQTAREQRLEAAGYNAVNIHPAHVEYDLMTDSWTDQVSPEISARMRDLRRRVDFSDTATHAATVFPFQHFLSVSQGRIAEAIFWRVAGKKDKVVVQNLLFPTTRHHIRGNRMEPVECPMRHVYARDSSDLFRGNLDCAQLRELIAEKGAGQIAYICIEAENNAAGGYPVSLANVIEMSALAKEHKIGMVLDSTRLFENAALIQRYEAGYSATPIREIVRQFCSHFDYMTCSLAKDFGTTRGGLIATNDERMLYRLKDALSIAGHGLTTHDKALVNTALHDVAFVEDAACRRVDQVARLHAACVAHGLPVVSPASGHCLVLDASDYLDPARYKNAVIALTAWIYAQSGVRGGLHVTGMSKDYASYSLIRFAIPLCTPDAKIDALTAPFIAALQHTAGIPDMRKTSNIPGIFGMMYAHYTPV